MIAKLDDNEISNIYNRICEEYNEHLYNQGVKLPRLRHKGTYNIYALILIYLAQKAPSDYVTVTKSELIEFIQRFHPSTSDIQPEQYLAKERGWFITTTENKYQLKSMTEPDPIFKENNTYRISLDNTFADPLKAKDYFKATDLYKINWPVIKSYTQHIIEIFKKINHVMDEKYRMPNDSFELFSSEIWRVYLALRETNIIENKFHNQGRPPENVYYNWMRGYAVSEFFRGIIAEMFDVKKDDISLSGQDNIDCIVDIIDEIRKNSVAATECGKPQANADLKKMLDTAVQNFNRNATADLEIESLNIRIEVQSGFTGDNDIKKSKAEAARLNKDNWKTYLIHFDLFNGRVAIINITSLLDDIPETAWVKNEKFESNTQTIKIAPTNFKWRITEPLPADKTELIVEKIETA